MAWMRLLRATVKASVHDDMLDWAAALSFYFMFALFPTILLVAALLGTLSLQSLTNNLVAALSRNLPYDAASLVSRELHSLLLKHVPGLISVGVILLLYSSSQGFAGLMSALNAAYEVPETRPYWRRMLIAFGLTLSAGIFIALALMLLVLGQKILTIIAGPFHAGVALQLTWPLIRWGLVLAFMVIAVRLLYRYAPNVHREGRGVYPAVTCALVLWIIASALLALYINHFSEYAVVYGSLGAIIGLMLWFYVFALALLLGAELHNEWLKAQGMKLVSFPNAKKTATVYRPTGSGGH
jgi:membrane protein